MPGHRDSTVHSIGKRELKDGTIVRRYRCVMPRVEVVASTPPSRGPKPKKKRKVEHEKIILAPDTHSFTVHPSQETPPKFSPVKCLEHPASKVIRWGAGRKQSTQHQRYRCEPGGDEPAHTFRLPLPRVRVEPDPQWRDADAVKNPHRGPTSSAREQVYTTDVVAEGLQRIALGQSYRSVGEWAVEFRPVRKTNPAKLQARLNAGGRKGRGKQTVGSVLRANHWQTAGDWVEMFAPVLWNAWQADLANEPEHTLPRVLVVDDQPLFGKLASSDNKRSEMVFSVLVATEYYQTEPAAIGYRKRVRLIRAYPTHRADAYELLLLDCGVPDVIVSDSGPGILRMVDRRKKRNPGIVWMPSAFHIGRQLEKQLAGMKWGKPATRFVPGDLADDLANYSFIASSKSWEQWWKNLDTRAAAQGVPAGAMPHEWRKRYYDRIHSALLFADQYPGIPRGTGAAEAYINTEVKPFFEGRATGFTNIERTNRAADLLTLRLNGRLSDRRKVATILRADAEGAGGFVPSARSITEPKGARLLLDPTIVELSLIAAREQAGIVVKEKKTRKIK
jgi:hypothetical protein